MKYNYLDEIWKDVPDYEGLYQASNLGRVKSLDRTVKHSSGKMMFFKGRILRQKTDKEGYKLVNLWSCNKGKMFRVHRLVWASFNGAIPDGMTVNHNDENPSNNKLSNLSLMSQRENNNYGRHNAKMSSTLTNGKTSKPVVGMDEDGNIVVTFPSTKEAYRNGYNHSTIAACCRGERKTHRGLRWKYKDGDC